MQSAPLDSKWIRRCDFIGRGGMDDVYFFEWDVILRKLLVKFYNKDAIIMYKIHMNNSRMLYLCCKKVRTVYLFIYFDRVQAIYLELQTVQK